MEEGLERDDLRSDSDIQFGIVDFSNIGTALLGVFQIISLDSWSTALYNLQKQGSNEFVPAIYCIMLIFIGTFFLLNLMLAVIMEQYMESEQKELKEKAEAIEMQKEELEMRLKCLANEYDQMDT